MVEDIFTTANRICQKEVNICLKPSSRKNKRGKVKNISFGRRIKALKKYLNVLHREFVKKHEAKCPHEPCIDCCHIVPIIRSRTEFHYLKAAVDLNHYARSLNVTIPALFKVWSQFCESVAVHPHHPHTNAGIMSDWMKRRTPCPLYSASYGECMVEDNKPIDCRFGRNLVCPSFFASRPEELSVQEIVSMSFDLRIVMASNVIKNPSYNVDLIDHGSETTWVDEVNNIMAKVDSQLFPENQPFRPQPIHTIFELGK